MKVNFFAAELYKGYWRHNHLEGAERVGVVTMTKKSLPFEDDD